MGALFWDRRRPRLLATSQACPEPQQARTPALPEERARQNFVATNYDSQKTDRARQVESTQVFLRPGATALDSVVYVAACYFVFSVILVTLITSPSIVPSTTTAKPDFVAVARRIASVLSFPAWSSL